MIGIQSKIIFWIGSGRRRVHLHLHPHRDAHDDRPDAEMQELAEHRACVGSKGIRPNRLKMVGRIRRRQILDPAEERRVPHLDGDEQHLVEREEHRDLDQDRQQPATAD
jgi:hypothetical protein